MAANGTTGKPKGAVRVKPVENPEHAMSRFSEGGLMRMMPEPIELVSAPMYHAMTTGWYLTLYAVGATHVFMPKFDGEKAFAAIERFRVNGFYMSEFVAISQKTYVTLPEPDASSYDSDNCATSAWGLDRIDSVDISFNNEYEWESDFPDGGAGANVYAFDAGIKVNNGDFGGKG